VSLSHEDVTKDWYSVLGVGKTSTPAQIKKAYRGLAKDLHPDNNPGDESAEKRFKDVSRAYAVLGEKEARAEYDEARRLGAGNPRPTAARHPGGATSAVNFEDLFGGAFSRGARQQRGEDLQAEVTIGFEAAMKGVETTVRLPGGGTCQTCNGNGARPGTQPQQCGRCHGTGTVSTNQGPFAFAQPCPSCGGRGEIVSDPCPTCRGTGSADRNVAVRLPAGVADGQRVRVKGRGGPGQRGGPAGDLEVLVRVAPHPVFAREDRTVTVTVPVSFAEAALGVTLRVPTPDGGAVRVKVAPGTASGTKLRVRGRGVPVSKSKPAGDLLVHVTVEVPTGVTAQTTVGELPPADRSKLESWLPVEATS
jgi:molecular chaperone DnaJ